MKYFTLLLVLLLCSCGSIKIKELKEDYTQPLTGKVKSINATMYEYRIVKNDTTVWTKSNLMEFDADNHLVKETKINEDEKTELNYKYTNGLLTETTSLPNKNNFKTVFTYDSNQNCIEEKAINDKATFYTTTRKFDTQNNVLEQNRKDFGNINQKVKTTYDYKQKTLITERSLDTLFIEPIKTKMTFNKKGFITRTETLIGNTPNNFDQYQFDTAGNLLQKTTHYSDGTIKETFSYQNTYDKKENIIARKNSTTENWLEKLRLILRIGSF